MSLHKRIMSAVSLISVLVALVLLNARPASAEAPCQDARSIGTAPAGYRLPVSAPTNITYAYGAGETHTGPSSYAIDYAAHRDTFEVVAAREGVVLDVNVDVGGFGWYVRVRHGDGRITFYAHMDPDNLFVGPNQPLYAGEAIGRVSNRDMNPQYSTGDHLHFEIREDWNAQVNLSGRSIDARAIPGTWFCTWYPDSPHTNGTLNGYSGLRQG